MKTLFFAAALLARIACSAQCELHTYIYQFGKWSDSLKSWQWDAGHAETAVINISDGVVSINNAAHRMLKIGNLLSNQSKDGIVASTWYAVDEQGEQCFFMVSYPYGKDLFLCSILYADIAIRYYVWDAGRGR